MRARIYGLTLDLPVEMPGTLPAPPGAPADVTVRFAAAPAAAPAPEVYRTPTLAGGTPPLVVARAADGSMRLDFAEGARFTVSADGRTVWAVWDPPLQADDAFTFLAGPVLGVVLRRLGALALHASAVVLAGGAWIFLGPGGAGKSTLAAAFARAGDAVLAEDLVALREAEGRWWASPGHHQVRLWEEGGALVAGAGAALPVVTAAWPKRAFDVVAQGLRFATDAVPVRGLLLLEERDPAAEQPILGTALPAGEAILALVAHSYASRLLETVALGWELLGFGAIVTAAPVRRLRVGSGTAGLDATVAAIRRLASDHHDVLTAG